MGKLFNVVWNCVFTGYNINELYERNFLIITCCLPLCTVWYNEIHAWFCCQDNRIIHIQICMHSFKIICNQKLNVSWVNQKCNLFCTCMKIIFIILVVIFSGACPGFFKGGSNISWFPKKSHQILKGGVQWSDGGGGGPVHLSH